MKRFKYLYYRLLWGCASKLPLRNLPVHLDLEVTSRCNLSCVMCPHYEKESSFKLGDMPIEIAKTLIKEGANQIKSIKFNWRGEPTLYHQLPEIIAYAKENGYIETMINTNLNCSAKFIGEVVCAGIDKIIVSIDSFNKNIYAQIRKGGHLDLVLNNLDYLKNIQKSTKYKFDVVVQARRQKLNESEIFPRGVLVKQATKRTEKGDYILGDQIATIRQNCMMPFRRLLVSWDGKVFGCCADWFEQNIIGRIENESLSDIWKGNDINKLRCDLESGQSFNYDPCKSCFSREAYKWKKLV